MDNNIAGARREELIVMLTGMALAAAVLLWASSSPAARAGGLDYSPFHLALIRFLIASIVMSLAAIFKRVRRPSLEDVPRIFLIGFLGITIYHVALNYGELMVTAGAASFIVNTIPIFTVILSACFLREHIGIGKWLGMVVGFFGVLLISVGERGKLQLNTGAFFILCSAFCQSLYFVLQKPLLKKYTPFEVVCYAIWVGTLFMLVFAPGLMEQIRHASNAATFSALYLGIFPGALAYFCWSFVLSKISASTAAAYLYLIPPAAVLIGYFWLAEIPRGFAIFGGCLALWGIIIVKLWDKPITSTNNNKEHDSEFMTLVIFSMKE